MPRRAPILRSPDFVIARAPNSHKYPMEPAFVEDYQLLGISALRTKDFVKAPCTLIGV
ncbi:hypothetical protein BD413DRAFT_570065 [Trametes elegans]|nr:hypothetical protein BD413DRAFT_570065 [Trametes elegans]